MADTYSLTRVSFRPQLKAKNPPISAYQRDRIWRIDADAVQVGTGDDAYFIQAIDLNPRAQVQNTTTDLVHFPTQDSEGAGSRFVFDVTQGSLRAGHANLQQWDEANRGDNSVAFGVDTMASGAGSLVLGGGDGTASGARAVVLGGSANTASGANAVAAGSGAMAVNDGSFVWAGPNPPLPTSITTDQDDQARIVASGGFRAVSGGTGLPAYTPGTIYIDAVDTLFAGDLNVSGAIQTTALAMDRQAAAPAAPGPAGTGLMWALESLPDALPRWTPFGGADTPLGTANLHGAFALTGADVEYSAVAPAQDIDAHFLVGPHELTGPSTGFRFMKGDSATGPFYGSFQAGGAETDEWDAPGRLSTALGLSCSSTGLATGIYGGRNNLNSGDYSVVMGGQDNQVTADYCFLGGGQNNTVAADYGTLVGGQQNQVMGTHATIGGGRLNTASGADSTVMCGLSNHASGTGATIIGGESNTASGDYSTVGAGIGNFATGLGSFVGGGGRVGTAAPATGVVNGNVASGDYSAVGAGTRNTASGDYSAVPGGSGNTASGDYSVAIGTDADTNGHAFTIALSDQNGLTGTEVTAPATMYAGFAGGIHFVTSADRTPTRLGVALAAGQSQWTSISDRRLKRNLRPFEGVLERLERLPLYEYSYIGNETGARCRGPMAQDWHELFPSRKPQDVIDTQDLDGVALAAIKELAGRTHKVAETHASAMERARAVLARTAPVA